MLESLSGKLNVVFQRLGRRGRLTENDIDEALREVRMALLESDVNYRVVRGFVDSVRGKALELNFANSLNPAQQVVKIAHEALQSLLGTEGNALSLKSSGATVVMLVGLNGSGKTTTAAKLGYFLVGAGHTCSLVAADWHRPAGMRQLEILGSGASLPIYTCAGNLANVGGVKLSVDRARQTGANCIVVDTAGRFELDDELMEELVKLRSEIMPDEILLVVDAMTGQEAVNVAKEFQVRVGVTGVVLSKLDGDARGGAALSINSVTGIPIKFIGTGERIEQLEKFYPDRLASRILGMGDVLTLIERAQTTFDQNKAVELEKKIRQSTFDLDDFLEQLQQLQKMGSVTQLMDMIPGSGGMKERLLSEGLDDNQLGRSKAILRSMTPTERRNPSIIGGSRRRRISKGSGTTPQEVNHLLNQFRQSQKLMRQFASGKGKNKLMHMIGQGGRVYGRQ